jgi:hypothetical protein
MNHLTRNVAIGAGALVAIGLIAQGQPQAQAPAPTPPASVVALVPTPISTSTPIVVITPVATQETTATPEPMATPEPTDTPAPTPAPRAVVKISGTSDSGKSKRFDLEGSYLVTISGKAKSDLIGGYQFGGGNVIVDLTSATDQTTGDNLVNEIAAGGKSYKFTTNEYGLSADTFFLDFTFPTGSWTVTFTPEAD